MLILVEKIVWSIFEKPHKENLKGNFNRFFQENETNIMRMIQINNVENILQILMEGELSPNDR